MNIRGLVSSKGRREKRYFSKDNNILSMSVNEPLTMKLSEQLKMFKTLCKENNCFPPHYRISKSFLSQRRGMSAKSDRKVNSNTSGNCSNSYMNSYSVQKHGKAKSSKTCSNYMTEMDKELLKRQQHVIYKLEETQKGNRPQTAKDGRYTSQLSNTIKNIISQSISRQSIKSALNQGFSQRKITGIKSSLSIEEKDAKGIEKIRIMKFKKNSLELADLTCYDEHNILSSDRLDKISELDIINIISNVPSSLESNSVHNEPLSFSFQQKQNQVAFPTPKSKRLSTHTNHTDNTKSPRTCSQIVVGKTGLLPAIKGETGKRIKNKTIVKSMSHDFIDNKRRELSPKKGVPECRSLNELRPNITKLKTSSGGRHKEERETISIPEEQQSSIKSPSITQKDYHLNLKSLRLCKSPLSPKSPRSPNLSMKSSKSLEQSLHKTLKLRSLKTEKKDANFSVNVSLVAKEKEQIKPNYNHIQNEKESIKEGNEKHYIKSERLSRGKRKNKQSRLKSSITNRVVFGAKKQLHVKSEENTRRKLVSYRERMQLLLDEEQAKHNPERKIVIPLSPSSKKSGEKHEEFYIKVPFSQKLERKNRFQDESTYSYEDSEISKSPLNLLYRKQNKEKSKEQKQSSDHNKMTSNNLAPLTSPHFPKESINLNVKFDLNDLSNLNNIILANDRKQMEMKREKAQTVFTRPEENKSVSVGKSSKRVKKIDSKIYHKIHRSKTPDLKAHCHIYRRSVSPNIHTMANRPQTASSCTHSLNIPSIFHTIKIAHNQLKKKNLNEIRSSSAELSKSYGAIQGKYLKNDIKPKKGYGKGNKSDDEFDKSNFLLTGHSVYTSITSNQSTLSPRKLQVRCSQKSDLFKVGSPRVKQTANPLYSSMKLPQTQKKLKGKRIITGVNRNESKSRQAIAKQESQGNSITSFSEVYKNHYKDLKNSLQITNSLPNAQQPTPTPPLTNAEAHFHKPISTVSHTNPISRMQNLTQHYNSRQTNPLITPNSNPLNSYCTSDNSNKSPHPLTQQHAHINNTNINAHSNINAQIYISGNSNININMNGNGNLNASGSASGKGSVGCMPNGNGLNGGALLCCAKNVQTNTLLQTNPPFVNSISSPFNVDLHKTHVPHVQNRFSSLKAIHFNVTGHSIHPIQVLEEEEMKKNTNIAFNLQNQHDQSQQVTPIPASSLDPTPIPYDHSEISQPTKSYYKERVTNISKRDELVNTDIQDPQIDSVDDFRDEIKFKHRASMKQSSKERKYYRSADSRRSPGSYHFESISSKASKAPRSPKHFKVRLKKRKAHPSSIHALNTGNSYYSGIVSGVGRSAVYSPGFTTASKMTAANSKHVLNQTSGMGTTIGTGSTLRSSKKYDMKLAHLDQFAEEIKDQYNSMLNKFSSMASALENPSLNPAKRDLNAKSSTAAYPSLLTQTKHAHFSDEKDQTTKDLIKVQDSSDANNRIYFPNVLKHEDYRKRSCDESVIEKDLIGREDKEGRRNGRYSIAESINNCVYNYNNFANTQKARAQMNLNHKQEFSEPQFNSAQPYQRMTECQVVVKRKHKSKENYQRKHIVLKNKSGKVAKGFSFPNESISNLQKAKRSLVQKMKIVRGTTLRGQDTIRSNGVVLDIFKY